MEDTPALTNDGRPKRWVVIRPDAGQTDILLARADGDAQTSIVGQQFGGRVGMFLRVDDFDTAYQRMVAAGARPGIFLYVTGFRQPVVWSRGVSAKRDAAASEDCADGTLH